MLKFGRNYLLKIKIGKRELNSASRAEVVTWQDEVIISYPLTLNFRVTREDFSITNSATFQLFNLSKSTRAKLYRDKFERSKYIQLEFYAGYGEDSTALPLVFVGEVYECFSYKEGQGVDFITNIICVTNFYGQCYMYSNRVIAKDTRPIDVITILCADAGLPLKYYSQEVVNSLSPLKRDTPFIGKSLDELKAFVNPTGVAVSNVIVDNMEVMVLGKYDVVESPVYQLTPSSGLLGYPKRRDSTLQVEMMFEPRLQECQKIEFKSGLDDYFDGTYKVVGFTHQGVISGAIGGRCSTSATLFTGIKSFNIAKEVKK